MTKVIRAALGVSVAVIFVWLISHHVSWQELSAVIARANPLWILVATGLFFLGYLCRIQRWRAMLKLDSPDLSLSACAGPFFASFAANNVLPFRAGDVLRAFAFNRQLGTTSGGVLATLLVERLLDLLMVIALLFAALVAFGLSSGQLMGVGAGMLVLAALAILTALFLPAVFSVFLNTAVALLTRVAPRLGAKVKTETDKGVVTLKKLSHGSRMALLIGWSIAAWLAEGGVFFCTALALPALDVPLASWLALPVGTLATLIPSTPGYVGTFDFFTAHAMALPGNTLVAATGYALLVHLILWLPPTVVGGTYLVARQIFTVEPKS